MIHENSTTFNVTTHEKYPKDLHLDFFSEEIMPAIRELVPLIPIYRGAMSEVSTKFNVLDYEFSMLHERNPIHHIECRIKSFSSIVEKAERRGYAPTLESLRENIRDIAGLRVVCSYLSDIYRLTDMLLAQTDVTLLRYTDYIKEPKPSGYRSLHLVISVPVFLSDRTEHVPVEVQLRTTTMDMWASREHELRYKAGAPVLTPELEARLTACSERCAELDEEMESILESIRELKTEWLDKAELFMK